MSTDESISENSILARLNELVQETDSEFVTELIDIFIKETPGHIKSIANALDAKDKQSLTITAHTLKGSSLNLGAKQLGAVCYKLEELGRSNNTISASITTKDIEIEFEKAKEILLAFKQNK